MPFRPLPDALLLGAMRAGTTFLHHALSAHPLIAPPAVKEPQFLSLRWNEGAGAYRRQMPLRGPAWTYRLTGRRRPLVIDASPYYLFHPSAPARARALLGASVKCVVLLRDPAERAWSHYRLELMRGAEHLGFFAALDAEAGRLAGEAERLARGEERPDAPHQVFSYQARGQYADQLDAWWRKVPREQFLLLSSADLFAQPQATLDRVCAFLGLPPARLPPDLPRNATPPGAMPAAARESLRRLFEPSNRRLLELTGIDLTSDSAA